MRYAGGLSLVSFTNTRVYYLLFFSNDRQVKIRDIPRWDRNPQIGKNSFFFLDVYLAAWTRLLVVSHSNWHTFWRHGISENGISRIMYSSAHLWYIVYYSWATSTYKCFLETNNLTSMFKGLRELKAEGSGGLALILGRRIWKGSAAPGFTIAASWFPSTVSWSFGSMGKMKSFCKWSSRALKCSWWKEVGQRLQVKIGRGKHYQVAWQ